MRIAALNEVARALGLTPGLALADARARVPDLETVDHDPAGDHALLEWLAESCALYSPMVALDPPDGIVLDITGCAHLWGGEAGLLSDLGARLAHQGFTARIALAETPDKARAMARHGQEQLSINRRVPPERLNEERSPYAAPLPIAALDLPEDQTRALHRAGLTSIAMLAERPRSVLAARFGEAMTAKLARVLGEEDVRITPRRSPPALSVAHRFAEPAARTAYVLEVIAELAREAQIELRQRGEGGRHFTVSLFRSDGDTRRLAIETGSATRDPALLMRLLRERIDTLADPLDPGFGYDAVRLDVANTQRLGAVQLQMEGGADPDAAVNPLLDRLAVRLGGARVRRLVPGNSHVPELAGLSVASASLSLSKGCFSSLGESGSVRRTALRQAQGSGDVETSNPPLRPLHLLDPPQRVEVIAAVPDGPPKRFRWRRRTHDVARHEGPERIASEWWTRKDGHIPGKGGLTRDYYRVEDSEGRRFWLFRHGLFGAEKANPDWYLHGVFV